MTATALYDALEARGVRLWVSRQGKLCAEAPPGTLTEPVRAAIEAAKPRLVKLLTAGDTAAHRAAQARADYEAALALWNEKARALGSDDILPDSPAGPAPTLRAYWEGEVWLRRLAILDAFKAKFYAVKPGPWIAEAQLLTEIEALGYGARQVRKELARWERNDVLFSHTETATGKRQWRYVGLSRQPYRVMCAPAFGPRYVPPEVEEVL